MEYNMDTPNGNKCQIPGLGKILGDFFGDTKGLVVEVGAYDGISWSNSYGLLKYGWAGVLVEANPDMCLVCRSNTADLDVNVIHRAAGAGEGTVRLYSGGSLSTTKEQSIDTYESIEYFKGIVNKSDYYDVPMSPLGSILAECAIEAVDLLVIDVEGAELDVLLGADLGRVSPRMVIIEMHELSEHAGLQVNNMSINSIMYDHGYSKIYADEINTIFIRP